ncbi:cytochrome P450 [Leucogyrophana mollusca]|uniref:Cytochrome P450 n=1 Tax=Leucogyrophana mollusca TaxID=85980 RepID=A0ACB8B1Q1_9AGAM|nr:cytochrome P450 [Leucogyrophana mollusca]
MAYTINVPLAVSAVFSVIAVVVLARRSTRERANPSGLPLPPGPRGFPLLGNIFDIDPARPWLTYTDWGKKYGDIVYSSLLGQDYIVINSVKVARDLLEQRSSISSGRPTPTLYKLFGVDFLTVMLGNTEEWKLHRKLFNLTLRMEVIVEHRDLYSRKAHHLILNMLRGSTESPGQVEEHLSDFSTAIIMAITYGYEVTSREDPLVVRVRKLNKVISSDMPAERAVVLTAFPLLRYLPGCFPGMAFKRDASDCNTLAAEVRDIPFDYVKEQVAAGIVSRSMVSNFFQSYKEDDIDDNMERAMKDTAATVFVAGADTTSFTLLTFVLAMVLYPDVQTRAQEEIDAVVGKDELPGFEHRSSLPYVEAILRETLRWHAVAPLGMPHVTTASDTYNGYYIPKGMSEAIFTLPILLTNRSLGAVMVYNLWAMSRASPDDADHFDPARYLLPYGQLSPKDSFSVSPSFGFGRRVCPGKFLAEESIWIAVVTMLATLRFAKALDADGREVEVTPEFTTGNVIRPIPFGCRTTSRSAGRVKELRAEFGPT